MLQDGRRQIGQGQAFGKMMHRGTEHGVEPGSHASLQRQRMPHPMGMGAVGTQDQLGREIQTQRSVHAGSVVWVVHYLAAPARGQRDRNPG
jgi:hypothetical protein